MLSAPGTARSRIWQATAPVHVSSTRCRSVSSVAFNHSKISRRPTKYARSIMPTDFIVLLQTPCQAAGASATYARRRRFENAAPRRCRRAAARRSRRPSRVDAARARRRRFENAAPRRRRRAAARRSRRPSRVDAARDPSQFESGPAPSACRRPGVVLCAALQQLTRARSQRPLTAARHTPTTPLLRGAGELCDKPPPRAPG